MSNNPSLQSKVEANDQDLQGNQPDSVYNDSKIAPDEVDIWDLVRLVWDGRIYIVIFSILFFGFGIFHVSSGPTEYLSDAILLQESQRETSTAQRFLQNFGGDFGGFNQQGRQGEISPNMYPLIIESVDFQYDLMFEEVQFSRFEEPISFYEFFNNHYETPFRQQVYDFILDYTLLFPFKLFDWIINFTLFEEEEIEEELEEIEEIDERLLSLSSDERRPMSQLIERINLTMEGNVITVETRMPDRNAAAMLNVLVIERIQEYVTEYKIEKAKQNVDFITRQKEEARANYEEVQERLAEFRDQNINLQSNIAITQEERLTNQRNLTFNIYNSISAELEQAKLRLQEETPVFNVMQRPSLPTSSLGTSNRIILVLMILGAFVGFAFIFAVKIYEKLSEELFGNNKNQTYT